MAYTLHEDNVGSDARWMTLAKRQEPDGAPDLLAMSASRRRAYLARLEVRKALLIAAYYLMQSESALSTDDGYLTQEAALACCTEPWILGALLTPVCDKPPLLHTKGQKCAAKNCIDASGPWREDYEYRVCAFLKRNPSRKEIERHKDQTADLRDTKLKTLVYDRDGGCCRYCRSGPLSNKAVRSKDRRKVLTFDHEDPDVAARPDGTGLLTACDRCNTVKGRRTPYEADMVVLAVPTDAEKAEWRARGMALFDLPDHGPITRRSPADQPPITESISDRVGDPISDRSRDPNGDLDTDSAEDPCPEQAEHDQDQSAKARADPLSRVGSGSPVMPDPPLTPSHPGQPERTARYPDIWHRGARTTSPPAEPAPSRREPPP